MRLMERIRTRFRLFFIGFAVIFTVSVFAGLGVGFFGRSMRSPSVVAPGETRTLVPGETAAASINGEPISYEDLYAHYEILRKQATGGLEQPQDPFGGLKVLSQALDNLFTQHALVQYARQENLGVSDGEVRQEIDKLLAQMFPPEEEGERSPSVFQQAGKAVRKSAERDRQLKEYLQTMAITLTMLKQQVRRELLVRKAYEKIDAEEAAKADAEAQDRLAKIQAGLDGGEDFGDLAKQYSDDTGTRDKGGVIDQMITRGFFDEAFDKVVFDLKVGEVSQPIKTEFGYQIVKVLDKKAAAGPEWEAAKPSLTEQLKKQKGPDYEPTEDELKAAYEEVKIQHITIRTLTQRQTSNRTYWLTFAADRRIYDPMLLAWRAVNTEPLLFPEEELKETTMEQLARDSLLKEGTDLSQLSELAREFTRVMLLRYQRSYGDPPEALRPRFEQYGLEYGVEYDPAEMPEYPELHALYPLAIGLVKRALELNDAIANYHYAIAFIYGEWLEDADGLERFPLDEDAARAEIERELTKAIELYEHNGYFYALAGRNYAYWVKPERAREMLAKAEQYAPGDPGLLRLIGSSYDVNGDTEKSREFMRLAMEEQRKQAGQQGGWVKVD